MLIDNNTCIDHYYLGEPGLSIYIEEENTRILFDTGYSDAFIKNAYKMGIDLTSLDYVVFSRGHPDHTWGFTDLFRLLMEAKNNKKEVEMPTILGHPLVFESKLHPAAGELGSLLSYDKVKKSFPLTLAKEPYWITDNLVFLGEIKRTFSFECKEKIGKVSMEDNEFDDYVQDDTALAYKSKDGLVIIVGCAHSGICNIIEYAKEVCGVDQVVDVIGGFHLLDPSEEQLQQTCAYFNNINPTYIHASHCTDLRSKIALAQGANIQEVGVGISLEYSNYHNTSGLD